MPPTIDPAKLPIPPMATAINPEIVKNCPLSNCSDMTGATRTPPIDPIIAANPKLSSIMARRSIPMSRAAAGFSAQARNARPNVVFRSSTHSPTMMTADTPASQMPCDGIRKPPMTSGASPENGGSA